MYTEAWEPLRPWEEHIGGSHNNVSTIQTVPLLMQVLHPQSEVERLDEEC